MHEATGRPLFAAIGEIGLNLAAARSEVEKLGQKVTAAARYRAGIQSRRLSIGVRSMPGVKHLIVKPPPLTVPMSGGSCELCGHWQEVDDA
jgi:hypothetical protein